MSHVIPLILSAALIGLSQPRQSFAEVQRLDEFQRDIKPLLEQYCVECHSGDDPHGDVSFDSFSSAAEIASSFKLWGRANQLLASRKMPPSDAAQPTANERSRFDAWYRNAFVESVEAKPATFRPRRLSATEYRNTLRSLFGFDLEVAVMEAEQTVTEKSLVIKLLPTDPPGKSRFRNDTSSNPLSTQAWEQYSYLADFALEELFSESRLEQLQSMSGMIPAAGFSEQNAEALIRHFAPRAWRRNLPAQEVDQIVARVQRERHATGTTDIVEATKRELKTILMHPAFLYRGFRASRSPGQHRVDEFELAERLSYFLWADMPDAELHRLASQGGLSDALAEQVNRMLDSPKARNLATDFATQWLALDEINHVSSNPPLMVALKSQPIDFFNYLISDNRPLLELIDSDTTFVNPLTRRFYQRDAKQLRQYRKPRGIEIEAVPNQRLKIEQTAGRGGLLTMPGVLAMNRGPILRGVWILERIIGEHLPDPPADVGQVAAQIPGEDLSFRQRFEQHRQDESCALCHDKIDPLGFALEDYDEKGNYRLAEFTRHQLRDKAKRRKNRTDEAEAEAGDTAGQLPSGEQFADFQQLKLILVTKQRAPIVKNIVEQMLAYSLCRELEIHDQPTVNTITEDMLTHDGTWRELIHAIVQSLPFREAIFAPSNDERDVE